jgi:hypothetical protein
MAKKSKDTTASTAKAEAKAKAPADPVTTKNLVRLLNILALLLAITAFLLQFFAVISHHWKYQITNLQPILSSPHLPVQAPVSNDSRIYQNYGLYTRGVKLYANHDEQLHVWANTRFPTLDNGDEDLHTCLSQTSTLKGSLLTCSSRLNSPGQCHCRRYAYWNAVIFFEVAALVLLGLVVVVSALLTTQYSGLLKLVGLALSFLAFLFLLVGLILILSYLKRETRSIADIYPHVHTQFGKHVSKYQQTVLHQVVRRQVHETYRAYSLSPGQHPYNRTHFTQYSEQENAWVYIPYTTLNTAPYAPLSQSGTQRTTTAAPPYNQYGPAIGYDKVYENTQAGIGWSTILSILALVLSLLLPLILAFSWLTAKKLGPETKTVTTTTVKTEYVPVPQEVTVETVPLTKQEVVVVRDDQPTTTTQTHHT